MACPISWHFHFFYKRVFSTGTFDLLKSPEIARFVELAEKQRFSLLWPFSGHFFKVEQGTGFFPNHILPRSAGSSLFPCPRLRDPVPPILRGTTIHLRENIPYVRIDTRRRGGCAEGKRGGCRDGEGERQREREKEEWKGKRKERGREVAPFQSSLSDLTRAPETSLILEVPRDSSSRLNSATWNVPPTTGAYRSPLSRPPPLFFRPPVALSVSVLLPLLPYFLFPVRPPRKSR